MGALGREEEATPGVGEPFRIEPTRLERHPLEVEQLRRVEEQDVPVVEVPVGEIDIDGVVTHRIARVPVALIVGHRVIDAVRC